MCALRSTPVRTRVYGASCGALPATDCASLSLAKAEQESWAGECELGTDEGSGRRSAGGIDEAQQRRGSEEERGKMKDEGGPVIRESVSRGEAGERARGRRIFNYQPHRAGGFTVTLAHGAQPQAIWALSECISWHTASILHHQRSHHGVGPMGIFRARFTRCLNLAPPALAPRSGSMGIFLARFTRISSQAVCF